MIHENYSHFRFFAPRSSNIVVIQITSSNTSSSNYILVRRTTQFTQNWQKENSKKVNEKRIAIANILFIYAESIQNINLAFFVRILPYISIYDCIYYTKLQQLWWLLCFSNIEFPVQANHDSILIKAKDVVSIESC